MATSKSAPPPQASPSWGSTTKLVVALSLVAILAGLLVYFRKIIGPLLVAFILAYLLHPLVTRINRHTKLNWRMAVNLVYFLLVVVLIAFLTVAGFAIIQQIQSLIRVVEQFIDSLPELAANLSTQVYTLGPLPFEISLSQFDLKTLSEQLLNTLRPLLGRVGSLVSTFAASAAVTFGWGLFILIISYFLLAETSQVSYQLVDVDIPGYDADIRRLGNELRLIWNTFLRGQFVIFILVIFIYSILLSILGVRYAVGIAILAGLARFVPYVGPIITLIITALVTLLQGQNYFGLIGWQYSLMVVVISLLVDQILDNVVTPRFLGQTLGVHPAAVLVGAIIAASLIGMVGLVIAAPVLATMKLVGRYVMRKMLDLDPWPETNHQMKLMEFPWTRLFRRMRVFRRIIQRK